MNFVPIEKNVLFDRSNGQVYAVQFRDNPEFTTGTPRPEDAEPEWLPVVAAYPEDMVPGHPHLLGPSTFEVDENFDPDVVLETYPEADYSPEAFYSYAKKRARDRARNALSQTDWYVIRKMETGAEIPGPVLQNRRAIRDAVDVDLQRLDSLSPTEWPEFAPTATADAVREAEGL